MKKNIKKIWQLKEDLLIALNSEKNLLEKDKLMNRLEVLWKEQDSLIL